MRHWLAILILCCMLTGCEDVNRRSPVPYVPVNYTLHITREYPHFMVDHGFQTMAITQKKFEREYIGYAGLLIWIGMDNQYHAADLCCPNCLKKNQPVQVDGLYAICPTCNEHFDLSSGYPFPTKGITKFPLRVYQAVPKQLSGLKILHILN
ncbi:MAG: hypothetical protein IKB40_02850 [Paludibacteraceae bacterium]|nr:hypothetical protein [Paludibacteraceae bacterium]